MKTFNANVDHSEYSLNSTLTSYEVKEVSSAKAAKILAVQKMTNDPSKKDLVERFKKHI